MSVGVDMGGEGGGDRVVSTTSVGICLFEDKLLDNEGIEDDDAEEEVDKEEEEEGTWDCSMLTSEEGDNNEGIEEFVESEVKNGSFSLANASASLVSGRTDEEEEDNEG